MKNNGHDPASAARADATLTDEQLMLELAHGRHEALGSLYSRHSRLVFYLALQSLERPAAEELVQEVFLTIWRGASAFDPEQGSFRPWLLRLAHWRILNELRRRHRRPQVQRNVDEEDELFQHVLDQEPGPEERAFQKEHRRIVDSALEALPPKQREAVALAFLEDMTHEQVAEALDVPLGTAKTRIRSGLHRLRGPGDREFVWSADQRTQHLLQEEHTAEERHRQHGGQRAIDERPANHEIDVEQSIAHDRQEQRGGNDSEEQWQDAKCREVGLPEQMLREPGAPRE